MAQIRKIISWRCNGEVKCFKCKKPLIKPYLEIHSYKSYADNGDTDSYTNSCYSCMEGKQNKKVWQEWIKETYNKKKNNLKDRLVELNKKQAKANKNYEEFTFNKFVENLKLKEQPDE